jgi:predicted Zn-dependent protease
MLGQIDEAISVTRYLISNDPVNANLFAVLAECYLWTGNFDDAIKNYESALMLSPQMMGVHNRIAEALLLKDKPQQALDFLQASPHGVSLASGAKIYHALGEHDASDAALAELVDKQERRSAGTIAKVLAFRGESNRAFEWLEKAAQNNDTGLLLILNEPDFNSLRDDPRWLPFLERIGFSPKQLGAVQFQVYLPE